MRWGLCLLIGLGLFTPWLSGCSVKRPPEAVIEPTFSFVDSRTGYLPKAPNADLELAAAEESAAAVVSSQEPRP